MKIFYFILLFIFFRAFNFIQAQVEDRESNFNIIGHAQFGSGNMVCDNEPTYIFNSYGGEFLLNYKLDKYSGIGTGIGIYNLSGNGFNSIGNFYHDRSLLKIPLILTFNSNKSSSDIEMILYLGI